MTKYRGLEFKRKLLENSGRFAFAGKLEKAGRQAEAPRKSMAR